MTNEQEILDEVERLPDPELGWGEEETAPKKKRPTPKAATPKSPLEQRLERARIWKRELDGQRSSAARQAKQAAPKGQGGVRASPVQRRGPTPRCCSTPAGS